RRRRMGNSVSRIRLLILRGKASSTSSTNSTYSITNSRKPDGGGTKPGGSCGAGSCIVRLLFCGTRTLARGSKVATQCVLTVGLVNADSAARGAFVFKHGRVPLN